MAAENGWNEWSKHVLAELTRLNGCYTDINGQLQKIHIEIAMLKVKSSIWGALGGCIPVLIMCLVYIMSKH